jgi:tetratricopeptide (TPR) repeat protein
MREIRFGSIFLAAVLASCAGMPRTQEIAAELPEGLYGIDEYLDEARKVREEETPYLPALPAPDPDDSRAALDKRQGEITSVASPAGSRSSGIMMALPPIPAVDPKIAQKQRPTLPAASAKPASQAQKPASTSTPKAAGTTGPGVAVNAAPVRTTAVETPPARVREIYARVSDEVEIGLEGEGYVFLGFPDKTQANGMSFKSKEARSGKTYFKFKAFSHGTYDLSFQRQDNATGKIVKEAVRIHVVSDADFETAVDLQSSLPARDAAQPETPDTAYADSLVLLGKYDAAIAEYMKGYRETDVFINDRVASVYVRRGDFEAAEKYYKRNLSPAGSFTERAVLGLVRIALARHDETALLSYLKPLLAIKDLDIEDYLIQAAVFQKERGDVGVGLTLMTEYMNRYPKGDRWDEAYFLLAQFLEADSPYRDIAKAREIYAMILGVFPESKFSGPSRDRLRYIEQHFYYVR